LKIIVAPDKFKGSLTAKQAAAAISRGIIKVVPQAIVDAVPMADGGEGTVETLVAAVKGRLNTTSATGPLGERVQAEWGECVVAGIKTAVIEMSAASGIKLVGGPNKSLEATTYGTGELIKAALDAGCRRIILGIGGSATTDGGIGVAEALGVHLLDAGGRRLDRGGGALTRLARIDTGEIDRRLSDTEILVAVDVDNPLYGPSGAAFVYGPQKDASATEVSQLDEGLRRLAAAIKNDLGISVAEIKGSGAAGGLGAGMVAFTGARLEPGFDLISEMVGLRERLAGANLVITGEGQIDLQTCHGKVPVGVAHLAQEENVPVVAVAGAIGPGAEEVYRCGLSAIEPICSRPMTFEEATEKAASLVGAASERLMRMMLVGSGL
jgi:glycerate kinase